MYLFVLRFTLVAHQKSFLLPPARVQLQCSMPLYTKGNTHPVLPVVVHDSTERRNNEINWMQQASLSVPWVVPFWRPSTIHLLGLHPAHPTSKSSCPRVQRPAELTRVGHQVEHEPDPEKINRILIRVDSI